MVQVLCPYLIPVWMFWTTHCMYVCRFMPVGKKIDQNLQKSILSLFWVCAFEIFPPSILAILMAALQSNLLHVAHWRTIIMLILKKLGTLRRYRCYCKYSKISQFCWNLQNVRFFQIWSWYRTPYNPATSGAWKHTHIHSTSLQFICTW